jgi:hypothetical protein
MGFPHGPVLAIETIDIAGFKENGQIVETHFGTAIVGETGMALAGAAGTDPVGNTVCRQRIVVIGDKSA